MFDVNFLLGVCLTLSVEFLALIAIILSKGGKK